VALAGDYSLAKNKGTIPMSNKFTMTFLDHGRAQKIGTLTFPDHSEPTLVVDDPASEQGQRLKQAWEKVKNLDSVTKKFTSNESVNSQGKVGFQTLEGSTVQKGSPDYAEAVMDFMSRTYGFFGTKVD
jgi:hypothetical protein